MRINGFFEKRRQRVTYSKRYTRSKAGNFFYFLFLTAAGLFSVLPLIYAVCTSFKPIDELLIFPPTFFVKRPTPVNYINLPNLIVSLNVPLSRYIFNSLFISVATTFLYIIITSMAAFVLCKATFGFKNLIISKLKIIDTYWVYILPFMASTLGVFLMKQYIEGYVPDALLEAASIDGASYYRIFWQIVMPVIKPAWLTVTLFTFRDVWATVPNGTVFTEALKTLPQIVTQITSGGIARTGSAMAITVIMMIPPILVYFVSQSNVVEAMSSAGIKG